jgi:hypothetical protein
MNSMMKEMKVGVFNYNNESYEFNFKTSLSAYDKLIFVKTVVGSIVDENGYDSVIRDLVFDFAIVAIFTNVDTSFINMKDDIGNDIAPIILIEHFLEESNVVDIVKANMEIGLLDELNRAVDLDIQYLTGIHVNPLSKAIENLVSTIEEKVDGIDLEAMMSMAQKFASMTDDFTVKNVVNEYMNSDMHMQNLAEIAEAKSE